MNGMQTSMNWRELKEKNMSVVGGAVSEVTCRCVDMQ